MEDFINKLVALAKGTGANLKRGFDGTAMEEMRAAERERNRDLINRAEPGGVPAYMRRQQEADPAEQQRLFGNPYVNTLRSLLNKP